MRDVSSLVLSKKCRSTPKYLFVKVTHEDENMCLVLGEHVAVRITQNRHYKTKHTEIQEPYRYRDRQLKDCQQTCKHKDFLTQLYTSIYHKLAKNCNPFFDGGCCSKKKKKKKKKEARICPSPGNKIHRGYCGNLSASVGKQSRQF